MLPIVFVKLLTTHIFLVACIDSQVNAIVTVTTGIYFFDAAVFHAQKHSGMDFGSVFIKIFHVLFLSVSQENSPHGWQKKTAGNSLRSA